MGASCSHCSNCGENIEDNKNNGNNNIIYNNGSNTNIRRIEENENTFLEEIKNIINNEEKTLVELDYLSQYYIHQKKDKIDHSISNQILMRYKNTINPFEENVDNNKGIIEIKNKIKKFEEKYKKKNINKIQIKSMSPSLNLTQRIENNYNFTFELKNVITDKIDKFIFNKYDISFIIIHFNIKSDIIIKKINEIIKFESQLKFKLILIAKDNKDLNIKDYLKFNIKEIKDCYILSSSNSKFIKLFGLEKDQYEFKCIIINENSKINLILENDVEFLSKEFIEYYIKRESSLNENDKNNYNLDSKTLLQEGVFEKNEFKSIIKEFKKEFNLEIEFKETSSVKYPINIKFKYFEVDRDVAKNVIRQLKNAMNSAYKIKKHFFAEKIQKTNVQKIQEDQKKIDELYSIIFNLNKEKEEKENKEKKELFEKEQYEKKIVELKKEIENLKKKIEEFEKEKDNYSKKMEGLIKEKENLEKNSQLEQNKKKELEEEIKQSKNKIEELNKELNQTKKKLEELKDSFVLLIKTHDENICYPIICKKNDKISEIKEKFCEQYPDYREYSKIKYRNEICDDSKRLVDYNIYGNADLYIIRKI